MPRPIRFEIHAADFARAQTFYETLFGWTFIAVMPGMFHAINTGEGPGIDGGLIPRRGPPGGDATPVIAWICTVDVPDVDAYLAKALANGGTLALPKMAIPGVGWLAYAKDTEGNVFGMSQTDPAAA